MNDGVKSYRQILRSTSIIGGASVINIAISLVRTKVAALLLGPAGVGLIGLFSNLIYTACTVASMGFDTVGTRQIAEATGRDDALALDRARRALLWGTRVLAILGALVFWLLREVLASRVLNDISLAGDLGWLAIGVGLTVAAASQSALLNGLRRISDLAWLSVLSALIAAILGIPILLIWGLQGLIAYMLLTPITTFLVGHILVARLPKLTSQKPLLGELVQQWKMMAQLGVTFMMAGVLVTVGQLIVRTLVQGQLGSTSLGHFEAAWVISMTYVGIVLRSMSSDYYPRLTAILHDHTAVNLLVNEQTEVALLLSSPIFLALLGLAPWIIELLYSKQFYEAADVLRWQILGDIFKVASWPLGVIILSAGAGRVYFFTEVFVVTIFAAFVWIGLPYLGLRATGIGFLIMYIVYLPIVYIYAKRKTGFRWQTGVLRRFTLLIILSVGTVGVAVYSTFAGALLGLSASIIFGVFGIARLAHVANLSGPLARLVHFYKRYV